MLFVVTKMFLRKKRINGREYYYLVQSTRVGGKVKKRERYVGLQKPSKSEMKRVFWEFDSVKSFLQKKQKVLESITSKHAKDMKRMPQDYRDDFFKQFVTKFTYDTSKIEGSTLSYKDTALLLNEGIAPAHKPSRDIREAENHKKAYELVLGMLKKKIDLRMILDLHRQLKQGVSEDAGNLRAGQVRVGNLIPINHSMIKQELTLLISWLIKNQNIHPMEKAGLFHCSFERIHPFFDGNGRIGRLLLNMILMQTGYPPLNIQHKNRRRYYTALQRADNGNYLYMIKYLVYELEEMYL